MKTPCLEFMEVQGVVAQLSGPGSIIENKCDKSPSRHYKSAKKEIFWKKNMLWMAEYISFTGNKELSRYNMLKQIVSSL